MPNRAFGRKGYLMVAMEPPPALEEEFNEWYDCEHVPERLRVTGFESAQRFICVSGWPRYLAFYDLESSRVMSSPGYRAISGDRFSPWTKRMLARAQGFYRSYGAQFWREFDPRASVATSQLVRLRHVDRNDVLKLRRFVQSDARGTEGVLRLRLLGDEAARDGTQLLLADLHAGGTLRLDALAGLERRIDMVNVYRLKSRLHRRSYHLIND